MNVKKSILIRVYVSFFLMVLFGAAIIFQIVKLQFSQKDKWLALSKEQSIRYRNVPASRGNIYAANGELMAASLPRFDVFWDSRASGIDNKLFEEKVDSLAFLLSLKFNNKTAQYWRKTLSEARKKKLRYVLIKRDIGYVTAKEMAQWPIFRLGKYKGGLILNEKNRRKLPYGLLAARTIGFSRETYHVGVEGAYDSILSGSNGSGLEEKMYGGVWRPIDDENRIDPKDGLDIYTTIDMELQDVAEDALYRTLMNNGAHHGCVVLLERETGAIKAIANLERMPDGSYAESYNYAIGEATDPGSTFKLLSFMALLEDEKVSLDDSIDLEGGKTRFYKQDMIDASYNGKKYETLRRCFELSSNVGTSKAVYAAYKNKPEQFLKHIYNARLHEKMGIEIRGEAQPLVKKPGQQGWSGTTLPWMSIGYEVLLTPLQIATFYNAIANDGKMMKPYLISDIKDAGRTVEKFMPVVLEKAICSKKTAKQLQGLMEGVVERGTATNLKDLGLKVAGKTGTAQVSNGSEGFSKNKHTASFAGYFPAQNPKYTCYVVVNRPAAGIYYGSLVAGPVFREIADKVYASVAFSTPIATTDEQAQIPWVKGGFIEEARTVLNSMGISSHSGLDSWPKWGGTSKKGLAIIFQQKQPSEKVVPEVYGWGLRDAVYVLENRGLKVQVRGYGRVVSQSIRAGNAVVKGATILIQLKP